MDELEPEDQLKWDALIPPALEKAAVAAKTLANEYVSQRGLDGALQNADLVVDDITRTCDNDPTHKNAGLRIDVRNNSVQARAPSLGLIGAFKWMFWFAALFEILVGLAQVITDDAGPAVIANGCLLAACATVTGYGLAGLWDARLPGQLEPTWQIRPPKRSSTQDFAAIGAGAVGIGILTFVRSFSLAGELVVISVTLVLALLVTVFKGLAISLSSKYDFLRSLVRLVQSWEANDALVRARPFLKRSTSLKCIGSTPPARIPLRSTKRLSK